jgi:hypothetical protein
VAVYLRQERFSQALQTTRKHILPSLNVITQNKRLKSWVEQVTMGARQILTEIEVAAGALTQDDHLEECPVVDGDELCWG